MEAVLPNRSMRSVVACRIAGCLVAGLLAAHAGDAEVNSAGSLRAKYAELRNQLGNNQFRKPLYLDSSESPDGVTGNVYALIDHPFGTAAAALNSPGDWCEILILHINTKYCRASVGNQGSILNVSIGKRYDQPLDQAYQVEFAYRVAAQTSNYLQVRLNADQGPLSTRDFRIMLEAVPLDTIGRSKVGFTVTGTQADGQPLHIGGTRGVVERNTMRYYLAIEAFLGALSAPPQARFEKRLHVQDASTG
jgi:hypothetical protein